MEAQLKGRTCIFTFTVKISYCTDAVSTGTTLLNADNISIRPLHVVPEAVYTDMCVIIRSVVDWLGNSSINVFQIRPSRIVSAARFIARECWAA